MDPGGEDGPAPMDADDREAYANTERFPGARQVIAGDFGETLAALAPTESSYIVIATRGHRSAATALRAFSTCW